MPLPKSKLQREYTLVQTCDDPALTMLRILIPEYDNTDQHFNKDMVVNDLAVRIKKDEPKKDKNKR